MKARLRVRKEGEYSRLILGFRAVYVVDRLRHVGERTGRHRCSRHCMGKTMDNSTARNGRDMIMRI